VCIPPYSSAESLLCLASTCLPHLFLCLALSSLVLSSPSPSRHSRIFSSWPSFFIPPLSLVYAAICPSPLLSFQVVYTFCLFVSSLRLGFALVSKILFPGIQQISIYWHTGTCCVTCNMNEFTYMYDRITKFVPVFLHCQIPKTFIKRQKSLSNSKDLHKKTKVMDAGCYTHTCIILVIGLGLE
jgi:hypothetical protein